MIAKTAKLISIFSTFWVSCFFLAIGLWLNSTFGEPSFEQILFHLQFGTEGLLDAPSKLILDFIVHCAGYSFLAASYIIAAHYIVQRVDEHGYKGINNNAIKYITSVIYKITLFVKSPIGPGAGRSLPYIILVISALFMLTKLSFWGYAGTHFKASQYSNFIDEHYVPPTNIIQPDRPRNLILIYVESLETPYADEDLFGRNLLKDIDRVTNGWESFEDFNQTWSTNYTMGAIISSQCGIPNKPLNRFDKDVLWGRLDGNSAGEKIDQFYPGVVCLGDILDKAGYTSIFLGGADTSFAGKGKFFKQHGYQEVLGKAEWANSGEQELGGWGLHDDRLFHHAKRKLEYLHSAGKPFNLTILTVDMHHPEGYINQTCQSEGVSDFAGIVECSSRLVADFLHYIFLNGYDTNTEIVLIGDHLSHKNPVDDLLSQKNSQRKIYNKFHSNQLLIKNREKIYPFSIFPTVMNMLGFRFPQNRLALGASGFGDLNPEYKLYEEINMVEKLSAPSDIYKSFWHTASNKE